MFPTVGVPNRCRYAVGHLDVKHIIVAGYYDCGAVGESLKKRVG
jgi:carbonic anhydrase